MKKFKTLPQQEYDFWFKPLIEIMDKENKKEFLYWDEDKAISAVEGYIGKSPDKTSAKKSGPELGGRVQRLYKIFLKLSSKEKQKLIKLIESEL